MKVLNEKHRALAEGMVKGTPIVQLAQELEVDRSTLYRWMENPKFQEYLGELQSQVDDAIRTRLAMSEVKVLHGIGMYLDIIVEALSTGERDVLTSIPSLDTMTQAAKRLSDMGRVSRGEPTSISEKRTAPPQGGERVKGLLRKLAPTTSDEDEIGDEEDGEATRH